ncbi:MAG: SWIM zinc finger family protein [Hyphomicrobiaceae bacterium]
MTQVCTCPSTGSPCAHARAPVWPDL